MLQTNITCKTYDSFSDPCLIAEKSLHVQYKEGNPKYTYTHRAMAGLITGEGFC